MYLDQLQIWLCIDPARGGILGMTRQFIVSDSPGTLTGEDVADHGILRPWTANMKQWAEDAFDSVDTDKTGVIKREQMPKLLKAINPALEGSETERQDEDAAGEAKGGAAAAGAAGGDARADAHVTNRGGLGLQEALDRLDIDGNGEVSKAEFL